nr:MAG TPA: hypothetical protein [Caudoviricetes sp.]
MAAFAHHLSCVHKYYSVYTQTAQPRIFHKLSPQKLCIMPKSSY